MPKCKCHGERMGWRRDPRYTLGGFYQCTVRNAERRREWYADLSGPAYNLLLLDDRRRKALVRRRKRKELHG